MPKNAQPLYAQPYEQHEDDWDDSTARHTLSSDAALMLATAAHQRHDWEASKAWLEYADRASRQRLTGILSR